jgi:galactonate dehydratase
MKITEAKTYIVGNPWKNWVFLRLETDEGIHGIGEATVNGFARTTATAIEELGAMYLGMDPFRIETIVQQMTRDVYTDGGQIHGCAVAAVEVACWDIIGKALGQPIYNFLGGRCHDRVRAYANGWYRGPRTPESFAEKAREVVRRGYTALKFDPFGSAWRITDPRDETLAIEIVAAVREAVGPDVDLLIEGHNRFSVSTAIKIGRRLEPYRPTWFEEPVHHQKIDSMVEVARHLDVPIATGESFSSTHQFAELLAHDAVHILQPEIQNLGGLLNTKKVCAMADAHYAVVAPHNAQGPVSTAMCLQIAACTPNFFIQELFDEFNVEWESQLVDQASRVVDGTIEIPARPGLGIDLCLEECERHPYAAQHFLPLFRSGWERREGAEG